MLRCNKFRYRTFWFTFVAAIVLIYQMISVKNQKRLRSMVQTMNSLVHTATPNPPAEQTKVLQWKNNKWEQQRDFCTGNLSFEKIDLKTPAGMTPIFIHPVKKDIFISGDLKRGGIWEAPHMKLFQTMMEREPEAGVMDIGSQLGTYALSAAKMGRKVIAVDPLEENVLRFCKSVQEGNLTQNVTIFFAAVSSSHKKVSFKGDPHNIGKTWIEEKPSGAVTAGNYSKFITDTSLLNDMLEEINFKKVIMKIDVEGHEYHALKAADNIFKNLDVRGIIMEWFHTSRTPVDGPKLVDLLLGYGFRPINIGGKSLSPDQFRSWPYDIAWEKHER